MLVGEMAPKSVRPYCKACCSLRRKNGCHGTVRTRKRNLSGIPDCQAGKMRSDNLLNYHNIRKHRKEKETEAACASGSQAAGGMLNAAGPDDDDFRKYGGRCAAWAQQVADCCPAVVVAKQPQQPVPISAF